MGITYYRLPSLSVEAATKWMERKWIQKRVIIKKNKLTSNMPKFYWYIGNKPSQVPNESVQAWSCEMIFCTHCLLPNTGTCSDLEGNERYWQNTALLMIKHNGSVVIS